MKKKKPAKKHKWSEGDEKILVEVVDSVKKLDEGVVATLGGLWPCISGTFFAKTDVAISPDACRHRSV